MEYRVIRGAQEFLPFMDKLQKAKTLGIDTETDGLDVHSNRMRLLQIAAEGLPVLLFDWNAFSGQGDQEAARNRELLRKCLETDAVKVFHNAKFDLKFLHKEGIRAGRVFDTMLAVQLLRGCGGSVKASLAAVAAYYLGEEVDKTEQKGDWSGELTRSQLEYAARDAELLLRLKPRLEKELAKYGLEKVAEIEFACVPAIALTEYEGIYLDEKKWEQLCAATRASYEEALERLYAYSGVPARQLTLWGEEEALDVNFDSNSYVLRLLKKNGIDVKSTSRTSLAPYHAHPLVRALSDYRRYAKLLNGFLYPIPQMIHPITGRLHPSYGQIGAWSGRMSCGNPNIQQIPRERAFRGCFCAPKGRKLILADYSQIELRVAAQISGDTRMRRAYRRGEDLHLLTASLISSTKAEMVTKEQRQAAKAVNFGLIFGMGAAGLQQYAAQSYGVDMTLEEARRFRDSFFEAYPGISWWHHDLMEKYGQSGGSALGSTLTGRKFRLSSRAGVAELANTPVQGTAADILKRALGLLYTEAVGRGWKIVAIVHDEILLEVAEEEAPEAARILKQKMEQAASDILPQVPCLADARIAESWAGKA